ncbi:GDSL lipase/esterase [Sporodiniella umbellata]|nr:GDSL lipase/esterase [Sporodiniella umbellata]
MFYFWTMALIFAFGIFPSEQYQRSKFENMIAFGDSYTDDMSLDYLYDKIYNRDKNSSHSEASSNGPLWVEYLQNITQIPNLYNFARSGATVNNKITPRGTQDLLTQVDIYSRSNIKNLNNTIYFIWIGLNDIHDLFLYHDNETQSLIDQIGSSVYDSLKKLSELGAKNLVLLNTVPLVSLPKFYAISTDSRARLHAMTKQYNTNLLSGMNKLNASELHILHFDTHKKFSELEKHKVGSPMSCNRGKNCNNLLWWDSLHPTTEIHLDIAYSVYQALLQMNF